MASRLTAAFPLLSSLAMLSACAATPTAAPTSTTSAELASSGSNAMTTNKWKEVHEGDSPALKVHWPDGHVTVGLDKHIADLADMFAFAPDTHAVAEPTKKANGEWTTVLCVASGTFTQPLSLPDGTNVAPNRKTFKIWVATITHATKGVVDEEYLFWNDKTLKSQIGI